LSRSMPELVYRRWREVEIHHADLGLTYRSADWPTGFVDREMQRLVSGLPDRLPEGTLLRLDAIDTGERWLVPAGGAEPHPVKAEKRHLLAWLLGRIDDPALPVIRPWE
jgi:maleylpyruvate isomerase